MVHRFAIRLTLLGYSIIALFGQQLHEWVEQFDADKLPAVCAIDQPSASPQIAVVPPIGCDHDCDHCPICQHHSLGQIFVAAPPAEITLAACELLSTPAPQSIAAPAIYSPSQPRAPPRAS